jgi:hypothetical protein
MNGQNTSMQCVFIWLSFASLSFAEPRMARAAWQEDGQTFDGPSGKICYEVTMPNTSKRRSTQSPKSELGRMGPQLHNG